MKKQIIIYLSIIFSVLFLILFGLVSSLSDATTSATSNLGSVALLSSVTATVGDSTEETQLSLPYTYEGIEPNTIITITAYFTSPDGNYLYLENDATSYSIYIDDELIYEYGMDNTYPDYLINPISTGQLIYIDADDGPIHLTIEFTAPESKDSFVIYPIYLGSYAGILTSLFQTLGFTFVFSIFLTYGGIFLMFISILIILFEKRAAIFFWLGLAAFAIGCWLLADCALLGFFIDYPVELYLRSLCGMIIFPIPLIYFGLSTVNFHKNWPLLLTALLELILGSFGLLFAYIGIIPITVIEDVFEVAVPTCVCIFAIAVLLEYIIYNNKSAQRFSIPAISLALFTLLDFLNEKRGFASMSITFFQVGALIFIISMGILAGLFIRDSFLLITDRNALTYKMSLMEHQIDGQKKHAELLMSNTSELRKQRHDLRHQLTAIKGLTKNDEKEQVLEYIDTLIDNIPVTRVNYCDNIAINSILSYYTTIGQKEGIEFNINIKLPQASSLINDTDYCVIFGNLIENAIEACRHITDDDKFITLNSRLQYNTFIITMENSFDGHYHTNNGMFYSRKRNEYGIGLSSVKNIAVKHGGDAQFKPNDNTFVSSVYFVV